MGLPPVPVYQPANEPGKPPRRGFRNLFSEQDAPETGQRGKQLCGHRQEYPHEPQIEPPEIIVVTADIPPVSAVNLLEGCGGVPLVRQEKIRQLVVDMSAAFTTKAADHQDRPCPVVLDKVPPAGADGVEPALADRAEARRSSAPHIKRLLPPSSIL